MSYPEFNKATTYGDGSLARGTCPFCAKEKDTGYYFCDYDCYAEGRKMLNKEQMSDNRISKFPILLDRDFKNIKPVNIDQEHIYWNEEKKLWFIKKDHLETYKKFYKEKNEERAILTRSIEVLSQ